MHVEIKTIPNNAEVAESLGLHLCNACGHPEEIHCGADHKKGECLCDFIAVELNGLLSNPHKKDLAQRLTNYYETVSHNKDVRRSVGSGI